MGEVDLDFVGQSDPTICGIYGAKKNHRPKHQTVHDCLYECRKQYDEMAEVVLQVRRVVSNVIYASKTISKIKEILNEKVDFQKPS